MNHNKFQYNAQMAGNSQDAGSEDEETAEEKSPVPDVWWHVNKNGFPLCEETWEKMWSYILKVHPQGEEVTRHIRGQKLKKAGRCFIGCSL